MANMGLKIAIGVVAILLFYVLMFIVVELYGDDLEEFNVAMEESLEQEVIQESISKEANREYLDRDLPTIHLNMVSPLSRVTDLQRKNMWKDYEGKYIKGSMFVVSVDDDIFGNLVVLGSHFPIGQKYSETHYSVHFKESERDKLLRVSKGQEVQFEAVLNRYHPILQTIGLDEAELVD